MTLHLDFWKGVALLSEFPASDSSVQVLLELIPMPDKSVGRILRVYARGANKKLLIKRVHIMLQNQCMQLYERLWARVESRIKVGLATITCSTNTRIETVWDRHAVIKQYLSGKVEMVTPHVSIAVGDLVPELVDDAHLTTTQSTLTDSSGM
jgi:hypothetical protein